MIVPIEKIIAKAEDTMSDATFNYEYERYEISSTEHTTPSFIASRHC